MPKLRHSCRLSMTFAVRSGFDRSRKQSVNILKQHRIMDVMVTATLHTHVTKTTHWLEDVGSSRIQLVEYSSMAPHFLQTVCTFPDIRIAQMLMVKHTFKLNLLRFGSVKFSYLKKRSGSNDSNAE